MTKTRKRVLTTSLLLATVFVLAGCGTATTSRTGGDQNVKQSSGDIVKTNPDGSRSLVVGAGQYAGAQNQDKWEALAKAQPKNAAMQIDAAMSAHVNGQDDLALSYYRRAIQSQPDSGIAWNGIGNIYLRDRGQPRIALPYYQKATKVDPQYGFGWLNLAIVQAQLNQKNQAIATLKNALNVVPISDPAYAYLGKEISSLS